MGNLQLTEENYHGDDANTAYLSFSQWKKFSQCEARWYAQYVEHSYTEPQSPALAEGQLFHTLVLEPDKEEDVLTEYADDLCTKTGLATAKCKDIYAMAEAVRDNESLMNVLVGEVERIFVGEVGGVPIKAKLDVFNEGVPFITDLKSVAQNQVYSYDPRWRERVHALYHRDYYIQLWLYEQLVMQNCFLPKNCLLGLVTATKPTNSFPDPDKWYVPIFHDHHQAVLDHAREQFLWKLDRFKHIRDYPGERERCENCHYCAVTRENFMLDVPMPKKMAEQAAWGNL